MSGVDSERKSLEAFFRSTFGKAAEGYVVLSLMNATTRKFRESWFRYPNDLDKLLDTIEQNKMGHNVYFCPQLFLEKQRKKQFVVATPSAWSDLDTCDPEKLLVEPTVVWQTSPGRWQALWRFEREVDPDDAEHLSKRIAYYHHEAGADKSGWDLTQLLRVPSTYNYKYSNESGMPPRIGVVSLNRNRYRMSDFDQYPETGGYTNVEIEMPDIDSLQDADDLLTEFRLKISNRAFQLFAQEPDDDWSKPLWNLQLMLFEADLTREQVFAIVREAKCNKYARDGRSEKLLWKDVCRAEAQNKTNIRLLTGQDDDEWQPPLLSDEERARVEQSPDTFVERYSTWAKSLGDAAPQYHEAGAFVCLSSLLAGTVRLPTSFGTILPNLWFMILADTTLTRKSTAMDIAMDMIGDIDPDAMLATDGSIEGLLTALAMRPNKPSIFLRDEFSGLLEMITKKDYYSGMPELLTKLYDGKMQRRVLRKETIDVRDPVLIFFAGGIKNKITSLLTSEHVSSGFMPRFIFITAVSDLSRVRPLGPPSNQSVDTGGAIRSELQDLYAHYRQGLTVNIKGQTASVGEERRWEAEMTTEAWIRYNKLEEQMLEAGLRTDKSDIMTPTYDRLSKSILKCAVLLAAARQREEKVLVEEIDILRAIYYGEQWRIYANEIMAAVGKGTYERQLDNVYRMVERMPGVTRSKIMQNFHLNARTATELFETLEQRGLIKRVRAGRTEQFFTFD